MPTPRDFVEIIIKLREGGTLRLAQGGRLEAPPLDLTELEHLVTGLPNAQLTRSFPRDPVEQVERHRRAEARLGRAIPSPNLFLRLRVPAAQDVDRILAGLADLDPASGIEYACRAGIPGPPPQVADLTGEQGYCDPTPDGVDAGYAWTLPGGDGAGVQVCDCEYGFDTQHQDLPLVAADVVTGWAALNNVLPALPAGFEDHGTAVLGILGAKADGVGVTGMCHGAGVLFASEATVARTACIEEAAAALGPGDVLLLEMQEKSGPVERPAEADPDVHAKILETVGNGVVVVEAAANGNTDLAMLTNTNGEAIWNPASPDQDDSLAILVGAGRAPAQASPSAAAATKLPTSNYGARVDCQGWGGRVVTTGYGVPTYLSNQADYNGGAHQEYTNGFNGTSAASAIVAGLVACLQGAAKAALGAPLAPGRIRNLLRSSRLGTPCAGEWPIGPLPDLYRILRSAGIVADVRVRDSDVLRARGPFDRPRLLRVPRTFQSPDLILRHHPVGDPDADLGPAAWEDADLSEAIAPGEDHWIYVRAQNHGTVSEGARVVVYWASPATWLPPRAWTRIGAIDLGEVDPGARVVGGPIRWRARHLPRSGHGVLVGLVESERDRAAVPGADSPDARTLAWLAVTHAVAFRAVHRVTAPRGGESVPFPIAVPGRDDADGRYRIAFLHDLPRGSTVKVTAGRPLTSPVPPLRPLGLSGRGEYTIADERYQVLDDVHVAAGARELVRVTAQVPDAAPVGCYPFAMAQLQGETLLGVVNVQFDVV